MADRWLGMRKAFRDAEIPGRIIESSPAKTRSAAIQGMPRDEEGELVDLGNSDTAAVYVENVATYRNNQLYMKADCR